MATEKITLAVDAPQFGAKVAYTTGGGYVEWEFLFDEMPSSTERVAEELEHVAAIIRALGRV